MVRCDEERLRRSWLCWGWALDIRRNPRAAIPRGEGGEAHVTSRISKEGRLGPPGIPLGRRPRGGGRASSLCALIIACVQMWICWYVTCRFCVKLVERGVAEVASSHTMIPTHPATSTAASREERVCRSPMTTLVSTKALHLSYCSTATRHGGT